MLAAAVLPFFHLAAADSAGFAELVGLWKAQHDFGPYARGALILEKTANGWWADFRGRRIAAHENDNVLTLTCQIAKAVSVRAFKRTARSPAGSGFNLFLR